MSTTTITINLTCAVTGNRYNKECDARVWAAYQRGTKPSRSKWGDDKGRGSVNLTQLDESPQNTRIHRA